MKAIIITGDDYGALQFEQKFLGTKVSDIVNNINDYTLIEHGGTVEDDGETYWEVQVYDVGQVSDEFISLYKKQIEDHDDKKHTRILFETDVLEG